MQPNPLNNAPIINHEQAGRIVDSGLADPYTRGLLVVALILLAALVTISAVWVFMWVPARRKERADERAYQLQRLDKEATVEKQKTDQAIAMSASANDLRGLGIDLRSALEIARVKCAHAHNECDGTPGGG